MWRMQQGCDKHGAVFLARAVKTINYRISEQSNNTNRREESRIIKVCHS